MFLSFHPSGRYAYSLNTGSSDLTGYAVDAATGALTPLGRQSLCDRLSDLGRDVRRHAAVHVRGDHAGIAAFSVDGSTGVQMSVGAVPAGERPVSRLG